MINFILPLIKMIFGVLSFVRGSFLEFNKRARSFIKSDCLSFLMPEIEKGHEKSSNVICVVTHIGPRHFLQLLKKNKNEMIFATNQMIFFEPFEELTFV